MQSLEKLDADGAAWNRANVRPLWLNDRSHGFGTEHHSSHWPWSEIRPLALRASVITDTDSAERRVLSFVRPEARPGDFETITNLTTGLQILLPGERARPHRHSPEALRFVLEGNDAVTRVDGVIAPMRRGDLVLTPAWCWHEHWHDGAEPIMWLDVLNVHTHQFLDTFVFEPGPPHDVPPAPPAAAFARANMVPDMHQTRSSPVFRYPLDDALAAADAAPPSRDGSRRARYVNPLTGGPVMPFLDCTLIRLEAGTPTARFRTSAHAVCAVVSGSGVTRVGPDSVAWRENDVFTLPQETWITHDAPETAYLFCVSDRELYRRLDLLTESYDNENVAGRLSQ
jgi:gentisate 1,2-dioxygenase